MESNNKINKKYFNRGINLNNKNKKTRLVLINYYAKNLDKYLNVNRKKNVPHFFITKNEEISREHPVILIEIKKNLSDKGPFK